MIGILLHFLLLSTSVGAFSSRGRRASTSRLFAGGGGDIDASNKPVLVIGATGQVGRRCVQQLMSKNVPVRALVRDLDKAQSIFGTSTGFQYPPLEIVKADLSKYDEDETADVLDRAVQGCGSVISVSGAFRFSKIADFLPWRLFKADVEGWCSNRCHPYYANWRAQRLLIDLAAKHGVQRFVRLTGLSVGLSAFSFVSVIFSGLLSMTSRYHFLTEEYLRASGVPHVILRPGGLASNERDPATTALQVDASGVLPPPARVGRSDVAALAVASTVSSILPSDKSYTLAVRWAGGETNPKPQGSKEDGCETAYDCLQEVSREEGSFVATKGMKPYGAAVAIFFYSFFALSLKLTTVLATNAMAIFQKLSLRFQ